MQIQLGGLLGDSDEVCLQRTRIGWCVAALLGTSPYVRTQEAGMGRMQGTIKSGKRTGSSTHQRLAADHTTAAIAAIGVCLLRRGRCRQGQSISSNTLACF